MIPAFAQNEILRKLDVYAISKKSINNYLNLLTKNVKLVEFSAEAWHQVHSICLENSEHRLCAQNILQEILEFWTALRLADKIPPEVLLWLQRIF